MDGLLGQQLADVRDALATAGQLIGTKVSSPPTGIHADPDTVHAWVPDAGGDATVKIDDGTLNVVGERHQGAADHLQSVSARTHPLIESFLGSLGPIFGDFRAAGLEVAGRRRADYESQASGHQDMVSGLSKAVSVWQVHEQDAAQQMRGVTDS